MKIEYTSNNQKHTFIFDETTILNQITICDKKMENASYSKYAANFNISGEVIISNDKLKTDNLYYFIDESYGEYLNFISNGLLKKDIWIYNILNEIAEVENTIYKDDKILITPNFTWDKKNIKKIYLLVIPFDINLRTIRSLNNVHLKLLNHMKNKAIEMCENFYNININTVKMFFHYPPSTYHLHLHVTTINNSDCNSSFEYTHDLIQVINNIKLKSDYYQSTDMKVIKK